MEQSTVVSIDRWSLYRGAVVSLRWPMGQPTVVSVDRWSLYRSAVVSLRWPMEDLYSGLYRQVVLIQKCSSITEVAHGGPLQWSL